MLRETTLNSLFISSFGTTDLGLVRSKNEDNFLINDSRGLYAVADGLGGVPYGDKASALAVQMVADYFDHSLMRGDIFIKEMFEEINSAIYKEGHRLNHDLGMATTLTVAQVNDNQLIVGHVGDSVLLLYRGGLLRQLTAEHTLKAAVCATLTPQECENVPEALGHTLTRCMGNSPEIEVDILELTLQAGDRLLLCTDGISKYVDQEFMEKAFAVSTSPETLAKTLVNEAHDRGGMDNATAVSFFMKSESPKIFGLGQPPVRVSSSPKSSIVRPDVEKTSKPLSKAKAEPVKARE